MFAMKNKIRAVGQGHQTERPQISHRLDYISAPSALKQERALLWFFQPATSKR